jgi:hypothetical protein
MYTDIILYTILILVIIYDVLAYLYDLFYSENSKKGLYTSPLILA